MYTAIVRTESEAISNGSSKLEPVGVGDYDDCCYPGKEVMFELLIRTGNDRNRRRLLVLVAATLCLASGIAKADPARIIFDTDLGNDIDDALALGMLHSLQTRGESVLLATTSTKDHPKSALLLDAINTFYGRPDIPIGAVRSGETPDEGRFLQIVDRKDETGFHFPRDLQQAADAVSLLRATLAGEEDGTVILVQVGFFTNLRRLLESGADDHSPLAGVDLVRRKVKFLSVMAGSFQTIADENHYIEWNILIDIPSAQVLARDWPTPIVWSGAEIGLSVPYPAQSIEEDYNYVKYHPLKEGYYLYKPPPHNRPTWDLTSVLYAVRPDRGYFDLSAPGRVTIEDDGFTRFDAVDGGRDRFLKLDALKIERLTEALVQLSSEPP
jgi:inosine-uridine nucleoside N-ribohydrolase